MIHEQAAFESSARFHPQIDAQFALRRQKLGEQRDESGQFRVLHLQMSLGFRPIRNFGFAGPEGFAQRQRTSQAHGLVLHQKVALRNPGEFAIELNGYLQIINGRYFWPVTEFDLAGV